MNFVIDEFGAMVGQAILLQTGGYQSCVCSAGKRIWCETGAGGVHIATEAFGEYSVTG